MKHLTLTSILTLLLITTAYAQTGNDVWNSYAENPDNHPNIVNNSFSGYHGGNIPIPDVPVVADLTDFGGVGDGVTDNTMAFRNAIDAAFENAHGEMGALYIPAGTYLVNDYIFMKYDGIVLRGEGTDLTIILFPNPLETVIGFAGSGTGTLYWSWQGGLVWFSPIEQMYMTVGRDGTNHDYHINENGYGSSNWNCWFSGGPVWEGPHLADVTGSHTRGDWTITVDDPSQLLPGDYYILAWENAAAADGYSLWKHIAGHPLMEQFYWDGATALNNRSQFQWPVQISRISGNNVTLEQPLRIDIRPEWNVAFEPIGPVIRDAGIENLTIQCVGAVPVGHNQNPGYNALFFTKAVNCFVRNVNITDCENGILCRATKNLTCDGVTWNGSVFFHHPITNVRSHDCLLDNFTINATCHHGISVEDLATGITYRRGLMNHGTFDSHRYMPFDLLRTNITLYNDGSPGGASDTGPFVGKNVVHWNVDITGPSGEFVNEPDAHSMGSLVGIKGPQNENCNWAMVCGEKGNIYADQNTTPVITDLYEKQRQHRKQTNPWVRLISHPNLIANPGNITLEATGCPPPGRNVNTIEFFIDGQSIGADNTTPFTADWNSSGGYFNFQLKMTDSDSQVTWSPTWRLIVANMQRLQEDHPDITYTGTNWKIETNPWMCGGAAMVTDSDSTDYFDYTFTGTRIRYFLARTSTFTYDKQGFAVFLDDMTTPVHTNYVRQYVDYMAYDSGFLTPGVHHLRVTHNPDNSGNRISLDHLDVWITDDTTPPPVVPPTNITATALAGDQIRLDWTDTNDNETGYVVERKPFPNTQDWQRVADLPADSTSFNDTDQIYGFILYTYRVGAVSQ